MSNPTTPSRNDAMQNVAQNRSSRTATDVLPFAQRLTCTVPEACKAIGLGRTKLYELIGGGVLETITIGRRRLVRVASLLNLVRSQSD